MVYRDDAHPVNVSLMNRPLIFGLVVALMGLAACSDDDGSNESAFAQDCPPESLALLALPDDQLPTGRAFVEATVVIAELRDGTAIELADLAGFDPLVAAIVSNHHRRPTDSEPAVRLIVQALELDRRLADLGVDAAGVDNFTEILARASWKHNHSPAEALVAALAGADNDQSNVATAKVDDLREFMSVMFDLAPTYETIDCFGVEIDFDVDDYPRECTAIDFDTRYVPADLVEPARTLVDAARAFDELRAGEIDDVDELLEAGFTQPVAEVIARHRADETTLDEAADQLVDTVEFDRVVESLGVGAGAIEEFRRSILEVSLHSIGSTSFTASRMLWFALYDIADDEALAVTQAATQLRQALTVTYGLDLRQRCETV
jgi:hypothetical protein